MRLVVDHVAGLGHRNIAYVGGPTALSTGHARNRGFRQAMRRAGIAPDPALIVLADGFAEAPGRIACERLIAAGGPFTAIVTANDLLALGCYDALAGAGLRCPRDVSVTGFNDIPYLGRMNPPLTTVRISHYHMGTRAAETVLALARQAAQPVQKLLLEPELVVRRSTATPRQD
jgi:LacI family transcriptional regulator